RFDADPDEALAVGVRADEMAVLADLDGGVDAGGHDRSSSRSSRAIVTRRSTPFWCARVSGRLIWSSTSGESAIRSHCERSSAGVAGSASANETGAAAANGGGAS